jgi:hypothetical protein
MIRDFDGLKRYEYEGLIVEPNATGTRLLIKEKGAPEGSGTNLTVSLSLDQARRLFDWLYVNLPRG